MWLLLRRCFLSLLRIGLAVFLLLAGILYFYQERLIYFPHRYAPGIESELPKGWQALHYTTRQGKQTAICQLPKQSPQHIWVFFGGNGSAAWSWMDMLALMPRGDAALLIEYPGYGFCEGLPTPASILESTEAAADLVAQRMGLSRAAFDERLNLVGHSLGCAAALQFAVRHPARQIVLFAPFTSMLEMARRTVGWPLCELCRHRFDNEARLRELSQRLSPPHVIIFHGVRDQTIPVAMSRRLAAEFPTMIELHEIPKATHNSVLLDNLTELLEIIRGTNPHEANFQPAEEKE